MPCWKSKSRSYDTKSEPKSTSTTSSSSKNGEVKKAKICANNKEYIEAKRAKLSVQSIIVSSPAPDSYEKSCEKCSCSSTISYQSDNLYEYESLPPALKPEEGKVGKTKENLKNSPIF